MDAHRVWSVSPSTVLLLRIGLFCAIGPTIAYSFSESAFLHIGGIRRAASFLRVKSVSDNPRCYTVMTTHQEQAIWELCRQGYPSLADEAEEKWIDGRPCYLDSRIKVSRILGALIDQANYELSLDDWNRKSSTMWNENHSAH